MSLTTPWPYPFWIAHRGGGTRAPENTMAAFRLGAQHGWRAFECDVKLSADGVPFLLHDTTLERTVVGASGVAADRTWRELSQLDAGGWHGADYAGEPPATLAGVITFALAGQHVLNLEIKPTPGQETLTGERVALEAQRMWGRHTPPPLLSSFEPPSLEAARRAVPSLPRALLLETLRPGWLDEAIALDCVAVVTDYLVMDAPALAALHAAGLRALCYTVNEPADAQRFIAMGIDGLISDAIDQLGPGSSMPSTRA